MKFNPQPKTFTPKKKRKPISKAKKATGEKEVFLEIWDKRPHFCEHCGDYLGEEPNAFFFSHVKPKSTHPELRLEPENIKLHCTDCHYAKDHQTKEQYEARKKV